MELFRVPCCPLCALSGQRCWIVWCFECSPEQELVKGKGYFMRRIQALCCVLLLGLSGCDFFVPQTSSGGTTNTGDYFYVGNGNNANIAGFGVSSAGALSVLSDEFDPTSRKTFSITEIDSWFPA